MMDIDFFMKSYDFMQELHAEQIKDKKYAFDLLESLRSKVPIVYNIETTNACNMKCVMCPRTKLMTRSIETMKMDLFTRIVDQLQPHQEDLWQEWEKFVEEKYGIRPTDMTENHFYLYVIPKVIQLHGYGDPLLDKNMAHYVKNLSDRGFNSYFSCNPSNINIDKTIEIFENGLDYIKYSIESVDDERHKKIRGQASNFTESRKKIFEILEIKKQKKLKTNIILTMLELNQEWQKDDYLKLKQIFKGKDVYIYMKSEDCQWYRGDLHGTNSLHWLEFCKHPWMTMTIKSNGEAAMCMEDFDNEIVLGDASEQSLYDIWNGEKYHQFRLDHIEAKAGIRCTARCDMKVVGDFLNQ